MTLENFNNLCSDWDFRKNYDMTKWHVGGVEFENEKAYIIIEKYDDVNDDYISYQKEINLNINDILSLNEDNVIEFIETLELKKGAN